jgi:DNA repair exonuclease SbcCD ATPase subunit
LEPSRDQLQTAISQLKELLQKPVGLVLLDVASVDQFRQVARLLTTHSSVLNEGGRALLGQFVQNTISNLQAAQEKRNRATCQEADHKQRVSQLQAHQLDLQTKASELKSIDQKVKSLEAELQLWRSKRTQKCLELQTVHAESQGLVQRVELISRAEQDIQTLQSEIADLEMLPLMSWAGLSAAFKEL